MEFIKWHYTKGIDFYISRWVYFLRWILHYFSLSLLIDTLFSPWKRLVDVDKSPGFNISRYFETLTFNLISRGIGAAVRLFIFFAGLFTLSVVFFGGAFGLVFWVLLPFLGIPVFSELQKTPEKFMERLEFKARSNPSLDTIFNNEAGLFTLNHIGLKLQDIASGTSKKIEFPSKKIKMYKDIIDSLVKKGFWADEFFQEHGFAKEDLLTSAGLWDKKMKLHKPIVRSTFGRPGIGLQLVFGYTPTLNQYCLDLSAPLSYTHRLIGRENIVQRMERVLSAGSSVLLTGSPGVGKKTVVLEFAHRAAEGELGSKMAFRRVLEFDYNSLLSTSLDLNKKKNLLDAILTEASYAGNIILMIRDIQRLTNSEVEGYDFTDVIEKHLEGKELKIIAVSTPSDYERFISKNLRLRKFLEKVEVTPPSKEEAMEILLEAAQNWESKKNIVILVQSLRKILDESDRYISEVPFPEKAIELLDSVILYCEQKGKNIIAVDDVNVVLSEKTGISFSNLTAEEKVKLENIEDIIHKRLVDQDAAVNLIGKSLRGRSVGIKEKNKPVGSFLFLGPTGVGKTETAKVLARAYYGSDSEILRFDMAEYAGREGLERLIGSVEKNQPGTLTTTIKNKPASLLLLDEIEKATPEISNLFLSLLDEGIITDAFGRRVNCKHLFVIATSNAGAEFIRQLVGSNPSPEDLQQKVVNFVLERGIFTPEFINRFDGVIVYQPLTTEVLYEIAKILLGEMVENLRNKNIHVEISDEAARKLAEDGYDPAFGARPMKRIIDLVIGDLIGKAFLKGEIKSTGKVRLVAGQQKNEYHLENI